MPRRMSDTVHAFSYDSQRHSAITYDANGNTLADPQGRSFTWDFENRLTQAVVPGTNGGTTTFKYDPFGRRIQKSGPLGTTNFVYDGQNVLEELDQSGNVLARYTHSEHDRDELADEPLAQLRSGTTSYYEQDGIDSVTSLTNPAGALANSYTFDAFGKLTASTGTLTNPFRYTGREFDPETGIYQYRMRYYDPSVGRFLSEDPVGFNGGDYNLFAYVLNSPTGLVDPLGLQHQPGGPWHPAPGVPFRCQGGLNRTQGDSCDVIMAKMAFIAAMMADHALWDMEHGGTRHSHTDKPSTDMDSLAGAFRRCLEMFNKYCVGDCPKNKPKPPEPPTDPFWWIPVIPRIPGPFPVIIDPCVLNPYASYCHNGPQA